MTDIDWLQVWKELTDNLSRQPRCPAHPQYPCIATLAQKSINDILVVHLRGIKVRSHRSGKEDFVDIDVFKTWWDHLLEFGSASVNTNDPNTPKTKRSSLIAAIFATCLPDLIEVREEPRLTIEYVNQ